MAFAQRLIDAGKRKGVEIGIYSYELSEIVPIASLGEVVIGKKYSDKTVYEDLERVVRKYEIRIILPFIDPFIEVCSILKGMLPDVFIPVSGVEIVRIMYDKLEADEWFRNNDFMVPERYNAATGKKFPMIAKPGQGSASKGIEVLWDEEQWEKFDKHRQGSYLIQEYIVDSEEYTVDCYVSQGHEIISVVPRIRVETLGGEAIISKTICDEELIRCSLDILKTGCFLGPITIQFIRDKRNNQLYVMEINPRYGGGVIASIAAGANTLEILLDEALGIPVKKIDSWLPETIMTRYLKEVIFYANNH